MMRFRLALLFALASQFHITGGQTPNPVSCMTGGGKCFAFPEKSMLRAPALKVCKEQGMILATVENKKEEIFLINEMSELNITEVLIDGLVEPPTFWRWLDGTPLQHQGCYNGRDANWVRMGTAKTPELCKNSCKFLKLNFVALKSDESCFCVKALSPKAYANCTCPPPALLGICPGNTLHFQVFSYYADSGGSSWDVGYPNGDVDETSCLAADAESGKWINDECLTKRGFICDNTGTTDECSNTAAGCIQVNTRDQLTWFDAKYTCEASGGRLAQTTNSQKQDAVMLALSKIEKSAETQQFWIGASNRRWKWSDERDFSYTNWLPGEPNTISALAGISVKNTESPGWKVNLGAPQPPACMYRLNSTAETTTAEKESSFTPPVPEITTITGHVTTTGDGISSSTLLPVEESGNTTTANVEKETTTIHGRYSTINVEVVSTTLPVTPTKLPVTPTPLYVTPTPNAETVTSSTPPPWFPDVASITNQQNNNQRQIYIAIGVVLAILIVIVASLTICFYRRRNSSNSMKTENAKGFKFTNRVFYHKKLKNEKETPDSSPARNDNDYTTDIYDLPTEIGAIDDGEMGDLSNVKTRDDEQGFTNLAYGCTSAKDIPTAAWGSGSNSKPDLSEYDNIPSSIQVSGQPTDECQYDYVLN